MIPIDRWIKLCDKITMKSLNSLQFEIIESGECRGLKFKIWKYIICNEEDLLDMVEKVNQKFDESQIEAFCLYVFN